MKQCLFDTGRNAFTEVISLTSNCPPVKVLENKIKNDKAKSLSTYSYCWLVQQVTIYQFSTIDHATVSPPRRGVTVSPPKSYIMGTFQAFFSKVIVRLFLGRP